MANTLKSKKQPKISEENLNPDKEADVSVTDVVKDERTSKIMGVISLLITLFLFVSFTSYLFTWQDDQDMVQLWRTHLFSINDLKVNNLMGYIGAFVAYQIMFNGFGLAAYLFCSFFFVLGVNLFFTKTIFSLWRNIRYVILGLLVISTCLAFVTAGAHFSWGGALGEYSSGWLIKWIGSFGTGALLLVAGFSYFIWRFNPSFNVPSFNFLIPKKKQAAFEGDDIVDTDETAVKQEWDLNATEQPNLGGNKLNNESFDELSLESEKVLEPQVLSAALTPTLIDSEEPVIANEVIEEPAPAVEKINIEDFNGELLEDLDLEIKPVAKEVIVPLGAIGTAYDATLDLKNYKYPSINLLETHGSEKIVQDPEELETHKNQIIATLKNYDIAIQRIAATVGPTVTLYEIVPAPGVRISRIKNLEDDIALSLAA